MKTSHIILALLALLLLGGGAYMLMQSSSGEQPVNTDSIPVEPNNGIGDGAEPLDELLGEETGEEISYENETVIGTSVNGTDITAYHFGNGANEVLLITGVHGSYSKNTAALGEDLVAHFASNEKLVGEDMRVTIIPVVNPDGLAVADDVKGRFNANGVDLNRNFGCDWAETSKWREQTVSGGDKPYSEPEAAAIRDYVNEANVVGAVVWYAAEGKVYPSACEGNPSAASINLAGAFADAAGYGIEKEFDAYQINGDMVNWMASKDIPAISVLLSDRKETEFEKNLKGVLGILASVAHRD